MKDKEVLKNGTKIVTCNCEHDYQDAKYGKGKRVANATKKTPGSIYRCTICRKEQ